MTLHQGCVWSGDRSVTMEAKSGGGRGQPAHQHALPLWGQRVASAHQTITGQSSLSLSRNPRG